MIAFPAGTKVWIAGGVTDMRRGMNTLALTVQRGLTLLHILMQIAGLDMIEDNIDENEFMQAMIASFSGDEAPPGNAIIKMAGGDDMKATNSKGET